MTKWNLPTIKTSNDRKEMHTYKPINMRSYFQEFRSEKFGIKHAFKIFGLTKRHTSKQTKQPDGYLLPAIDDGIYSLSVKFYHSPNHATSCTAQRWLNKKEYKKRFALRRFHFQPTSCLVKINRNVQFY